MTTAESITINLEDWTPDTALPVEDDFRHAYDFNVSEGRKIAADKTVVICGMARNIGAILPHTLRRLEEIGACFGDWRAVVVENDSADNTKAVLQEWAGKHPGKVIADCRDLGREHLHGFEAERVQRYADYRQQYVDLSNVKDDELLLAVDLDPWGGYSVEGILSSVYWLKVLVHSAGMASTSLYQGVTPDGNPIWGHYDQWAFRHWTFTPRWDDYFLRWLPPPGAPPIKVRSAFGACCLYRGEAIRTCRYESIDGDIEHVGLHKHMAESGWTFHLNPASRVVMHWQP